MQSVLKLLNESGAAGLAHGNTRTLRDHLAGTGCILSHWRQPAEVIAGGMLHSIYSTDIYQQKLLRLTNRGKVARVAGSPAERLAFLFGIVRRESLFQAIERVAGAAWREVEVECHQGPERVTIPKRRAGNLLLIYMANQAEQSQAADMGPGVWVSGVSRWASLAKPLVKRPPPVFDSCSVRISLDQERAARYWYSRGLVLLERGSDGAAAFSRAAAQLPWVAEPALLLAYSLVLQSAWVDAFSHATTALRRLDEWGTAWDKRLRFDEWKAVANALANRCEDAFRRPAAAARRVRESAADPSLGWTGALRTMGNRPATPRPLPAPELPERFVTYLKTFGSRQAAAKHNHYPGLRKEPVHPANAFPVARALEKSFEKIRTEFQALRLDQGFQDEVERIARTGSWNIFMLYELGRRVDANCALCPLTTSVAEKHGAVHSISNALYFSVLAPQTRVAAHTGPTNMRLRCHLGIEVPEACGLRVGTEVLTWREGECLVFDDSFQHEVWNDSDQRRVVLVADLWHPDLTNEEVDLLDGLQRYAYAHAHSMSGYWANNDRARRSYTEGVTA